MKNGKNRFDQIDDLKEFFQVLGDETRLRIMLTLEGREMCVSDLSEELKMTVSAVSHQLKLLKYAGLVKARRDGKNMYYSFDDDHVVNIVDTAIEHMRHLAE